MYAAEHAALVNDAYSVLKNPLSRANYIVCPAPAHSCLGRLSDVRPVPQLAQAGLLSDDDERQTITDQQLLVEVRSCGCCGCVV
jgi:curved DNA-binding protein CbpA